MMGSVRFPFLLQSRRMSVVTLMLGLALCCGLSGCDSASTVDANALTFVAALLPDEKAAYERILEDFTTTTGIHVTLVTQQYEQVRTAVEAEAQAGRGEFDVVELDLHQLGMMAQHMQPIRLPGVESSAELRVQVPPEAWAAGLSGVGHELTYIPHRLNWQALIYNAEVLRTPPDTWDDLLQVAGEHPGAIGIKAARYEGLTCDLFSFLWQGGADPLRPDTPQALATMQFLAQLGPGLNASARSFKENTALAALEHREILLHPNWSFAVPLLHRKNLLPGTFRTAPLPAGPAGRATVLGGGYLGVPRTASNAEGAMLLIAHLTARETQRRMMQELGWFPMRNDVLVDLDAETRELYAGFLAMREHVRARPVLDDYDQLSRAWQDAFYRIVFDGDDAATTLREMQAAFSRDLLAAAQ